MGTINRTEHIMGVGHVRDPVAHGLVDRVLQRLAAAVHGAHNGAQELHAENVQGLASNIIGAHIHFAVETEHGGSRRRCHSVLAGAGLRDHTGLAHALREQNLGKGVVDLVSAGVAEILALEIDFRSAEMLRQSLRKIERRGTADEFPVVELKLGQEGLVLLCGKIGRFEPGKRGHKRFRSELPAVDAEVSLFVRNAHGRDTLRTSAMNFFTFAWSLVPFPFSTPPATSTA